jgi:ElaB protein
MSAELTTNLGTVEGKKDVLVKDIKTVVGDTDVLLRGIAGAATDSYAATRARVEGKLGEARTSFDETRAQIAARARGLADTSQAYVKDNPWKVLGATAIVGLVLGVLLRRR